MSDPVDANKAGRDSRKLDLMPIFDKYRDERADILKGLIEADLYAGKWAGEYKVNWRRLYDNETSWLAQFTQTYPKIDFELIKAPGEHSWLRWKIKTQFL